jgi:uncharacterized RDD family membrane protein YckC
MKCPKCGYLGFEHVERCRNCGYEFALTAPSTDADLKLRDPASRAALGLSDLTLGPQAQVEQGADAPLRTRDGRLTTRSAGELPLFPKSGSDDFHVSPPPAPRPLAVRRATPEVRKARVERPSTPPTLDQAQPESEPKPPSVPLARPPVHVSRASLEVGEPASMALRAVAAGIDLTVLGAIDALVVYFTLRICGLTIADITLLPKLPLGAFLLVQNLGYLVAFTAGGQTLGKMATGLRVVPDTSGIRLDFSRAVVRSVVWALLAIPAGLGFMTALMSADQRGLHDRCAGTRVVRAGAA